MIGAKKLRLPDVIKIRALMDQGLSDTQISREFIPESGQCVTREHINGIRHGKRWNMERHSFIMKSDSETLFVIKTEVDGNVYETQEGYMCTKTSQNWFLAHLMNSKEVCGPMLYLTKNRPLKQEILNLHNLFVESQL